MKKKRFITLLACLTMACASIGVASACSGGGDTSSGSDSGSNVETPIEIEYKVKFETSGGSTVKTQDVKKGEKATKPEDPTRENYTFVEWQLNGNTYNFESPVIADITLKAKWEKKEPTKFSVSFVVEGEPFHTANVEDGKKVMQPAENPTRENYIFDGWTLNGETYDFETPITEAITLVAKWANAWTVSFDGGEGTSIEPVVVKDGETISAPEIKKDGYYVFDWLKDGQSYQFEMPVTENMTLTAVWKAYGLGSNQIAVIAGAWNQPGTDFINVSTGANDEMIVAAKFKGDQWRWPALVLRNLFEKAYYETLIASGDTQLKFNLTVGGESAASVSDLYVFGKLLSEFPQKDGVYTVVVDLQYLVDNYDTIGVLGTKYEAKPSQYFEQMLLAWKCSASNYSQTRNYVFTISDVTVRPAPTLNVAFAEGSEDLIEVGKTTTLTAQTNVDEAVAWSSSNEAIATVENGVVTGIKGGETTITATIDGVTASKTIYIVGDGLYADQIGIRVNGNEVSSNQAYFKKVVGTNGEIILTVNNFNADATYNPGLLFNKNIFSKAYYEKLAASGYTKLNFTLGVGGTNAEDVEDLYVFGKQLTTFAKNANGEYEVAVDVSTIIYYYATIKDLATLTTQAGQSSSLNAKFIAWKSPAGDYATKRNYVFTISNAEFLENIETEV